MIESMAVPTQRQWLIQNLIEMDIPQSHVQQIVAHATYVASRLASCHAIQDARVERINNELVRLRELDDVDEIVGFEMGKKLFYF